MRLYWIAVFTIFVGLPQLCLAQALDRELFGVGFRPIDSRDVSKGYICQPPLVHSDVGSRVEYKRHPVYDKVDRVVIGLFNRPDDNLPASLTGEAIALRVKDFYEQRFRKFPEGVKETNTPGCYGRNNQKVEILSATGREQRRKLFSIAAQPNVLHIMLRVYTVRFQDVPAVEIAIMSSRSKSGVTLYDSRPLFAIFPLSLSDEEASKQVSLMISNQVE